MIVCLILFHNLLLGFVFLLPLYLFSHPGWRSLESLFIGRFLDFHYLYTEITVKLVPCDLKVTGSSRGIGHWKQVRPPTIHPSGCGPSPDPAYAGYFVHRAALFLGKLLLLVL